MNLMFVGQGLNQVDGFLQGKAHAHRLERKLNVVGFGPADVEHFVDQFEKMAARRQNLAQVRTLVGP